MTMTEAVESVVYRVSYVSNAGKQVTRDFSHHPSAVAHKREVDALYGHRRAVIFTIIVTPGS